MKCSGCENPAFDNWDVCWDCFHLEEAKRREETVCEDTPQIKKRRPVLTFGNRLILADMKALFDELQEFYDHDDGDVEIEISFVEMTDAEIEALPEFKGY